MRTRLGPALLGALLASLVLAGCGDEKPGNQASDPPRGEVESTLVEMISETSVGGMVSPGGVALTDAGAVQQFAGQFSEDRMQVRLSQEFADLEVPDDKRAYAAVVAIGCNPPTEVTVTDTDTGILIEQVKPKTKPVQCLAPVTSVALVLVDASLVD